MLVETDLDVGALFEAHGIDETHLALVERENHGRGADAFAEEAHAFQDVSVGDTGAGENDFFAGGEILGVIDALGVGDAHFCQALGILGFADDQACENLAVEAAQGRGGEHAFWGAAGAYQHVNAGADYGSGDARGQVAVANQADTRADLANLFDHFFVTRAIENHDNQIFHVAVEALGDGLQVIGDGGVELHGAFAGWADDNFFHVQIGGVEEASLFAGGEHGDGIGRAGGAEIGAFERVNGNIHRRENGLGRVLGEADFFADVEHGRFVAFAFADGDGAVHFHLVHGFAHGFDGDFVGFVAIAKSHGAGGSDG